MGSSLDTLDDIRLASAEPQDDPDLELATTPTPEYSQARSLIDKSLNLIPKNLVEKFKKPAVAASEMIPLSERKRKGQNVAIRYKEFSLN